MERTLSNTNPQQAAANGWVVDKGDPGAWETICKAHSDFAGIMKSTKRMEVPGGWLYQVTTETPKGIAEALAFVPKLALLLLALLAAGSAHAQRPAQCYDTSNRPYDLSAICGDSNLAWPTICRPAYVGSMGETIPEFCATFSPDAGDSAEGMTLYDPETGYRPPAAVVLANLRQTEALLMFGRIGYHWNAAYPAHESAYMTGLDFGQYNELVNLAASGARDSGLGTHVRYTWTGPYYADTLAGVAALCGAGTALNTRCGRAAQTVNEVENFSTRMAEGMGYHNGASLSQPTLVTMFNVLKRPMVPNPADTTCGRPLLCEMP